MVTKESKEETRRVWPDLKVIRTELGLSQVEMAVYLGMSVRAVQSCEQGWRKMSSSVEKVLLLMLIAHRQNGNLHQMACWDAVCCGAELRERCPVFTTKLGYLCWYLSGNLCKGSRNLNWADKLALCRKCSFFHVLLKEDVSPR